VVSVCLVFSSCSSSPERESVKIEDQAIKLSEPGGSTAPQAAPTTAPAATTTNGEQKFGEERLLGDNSRLTVSYDGSGNKTETRVFPEGSEVKFVRVYTARDGTVEATIYSQNGDVRPVPSGMSRGILLAPASEISSSVNPVSSVQQPELPQPATQVPQQVAQTRTAEKVAPSVPETTSVQLPPVSRSKPPAE
jgi:hypothetical protein